jgi:hypothetical protein
MIEIQYNGIDSESVERYCQRRFVKYSRIKSLIHGDKIAVVQDGNTVYLCDNVAQLDEILTLSQNRLLPTLKEIGFFLIRGSLTALGFITIEILYEKWRKWE